MMTWGDRWLAEEAGPPITLHHNACGHDTQAEVVCAHCKEPLTADEVRHRMGPGYPEKLATRPDVVRRFAAQNDR